MFVFACLQLLELIYGIRDSLAAQNLANGGKSVTSARGYPFAGHNVYGIIINTDPKMARIMGRDFHKVPQGVDGTPAANRERETHPAPPCSTRPARTSLLACRHSPAAAAVHNRP